MSLPAPVTSAGPSLGWSWLLQPPLSELEGVPGLGAPGPGPLQGLMVLEGGDVCAKESPGCLGHPRAFCQGVVEPGGGSATLPCGSWTPMGSGTTLVPA